ncbi:MAG TPA: hypothetical protein VFI73_06850 [Candidatus Nitrosopolaris sp.]|nr:hypothetical protein [Candidatus Nitrosopolaris sp.]
MQVISNGEVAFAQVHSSLKSSTTINPVGNSNNDNNITTINASINKLNFTSATGTIASLQNDANGKPAWIVSGQWQMLVFKPRLTESQPKPATIIFNTVFDMVRSDGAALHTHTISSALNLTSISNSVNNSTHLSSTTINGTARLVTMGLPNMVSVSNMNVPVSVKIIDRSAFSLWIDPNKIGNHFGNTPIYGIVATKSG